MCDDGRGSGEAEEEAGRPSPSSMRSPFLGGFLVELSWPLTSCSRFSSSRFFSSASSSFVFPTGFFMAAGRKGEARFGTQPRPPKTLLASTPRHLLSL